MRLKRAAAGFQARLASELRERALPAPRVSQRPCSRWCARVVLLSFVIQTAEEKVPVWYVMDEFGSRIQHSDQPSFATAPLFYVPQQIAYTVLWPLRDLETGGKCLSVEVGVLRPPQKVDGILTNHGAFHSRTNISAPK